MSRAQSVSAIQGVWRGPRRCPLRTLLGADRASTQHTSTHRPRPRSLSRASMRDFIRARARAQARRGRARHMRPPALTPCLTMYCPLEQSSALITRTLHAGTAASAVDVCPSQAVTIRPCAASPPARALPSIWRPAGLSRLMSCSCCREWRNGGGFRQTYQNYKTIVRGMATQ
jgi:hypothetical protein